MEQTESGGSVVFVAGHRGMVGSALLRAAGRCERVRVLTRTRAELDLTDQAQVSAFFAAERIDCVYLAAAKVGGIQANATRPAEFIHQNLAIATNVIHEAWRAGVGQLLFLGSSCIYPRRAPQPMPESALLTGSLEPTNRPYAVAKIAGLELVRSYCRQYGMDYRAVMPTNLYGPGDNFDLETSHVLPALIRKFHEAKLEDRRSVSVWGTGRPRREFLHVDDLADACIFLTRLPRARWEAAAAEGYVNVGWGEDISIGELAETIADVAGYAGAIEFDRSRPDGTPRKLLDVSVLSRLGWKPRIDLRSGIRQVYDWYAANRADRQHHTNPQLGAGR